MTSSAKLTELRLSIIDAISTCINDFLEFFTTAYSTQGGKIHLRITSNMPYIKKNTTMNSFCQDIVQNFSFWIKNSIANFVVSLQANFALCNKKDDFFKGRV